VLSVNFNWLISSRDILNKFNDPKLVLLTGWYTLTVHLLKTLQLLDMYMVRWVISCVHSLRLDSLTQYGCPADVILSSWPDETDSSGFKVRNISYTLTLTNPLGPKTSPSTERQVSKVSFCICLSRL